MAFLDIFSAPIPTLRICMLGPRAVGKTTVLTSIFADTQSDLAGTGLFFRYKEGSDSSKLTGYQSKLKACIAQQDPSNLPASLDISNFDFEVGYSGKVKTNIVLKDYPGEFLTDTSKQHFVTEFLNESNVVIVAIDTPYLMEENGKYNEQKNHPQIVMDFIKKHPKGFKDKLMLLVPLKCERYFHDGLMDQVAARIKTVYQDLIKFCRENNVACVIAPILTLGGIELDRMVHNNKVGEIEKLPEYRMYQKNPKYKPMFCVQPMYYLMLYSANYSEWAANHAEGILAKLQVIISKMFTNDEKFRTALREMRKNLLYDKLGYEVLTNNSILKF